MAEKTMMLEIISPDRMFYKGDVVLLEMTTTEGEAGIYPGHIPMTNILVSGMITIHEENDLKRAVVHAGFCQILQDKVTILAEIAEWPDEIDIPRDKETQESYKQTIYQI